MSEGMSVAMVGRLVTKEAGRLYSSSVYADVRINRTVGNV